MLIIFAVISLGMTTAVFGQGAETPVLDVEFNFTAAEGAVIIVGILGGLTTAYLGYRNAKRNADPAKPVTFDLTLFLDRLIPASITGVGLAIASAANITELNLFSLFLIFTSTIGTTEIVLQVWNKDRKK